MHDVDRRAGDEIANDRARQVLGRQLTDEAGRRLRNAPGKKNTQAKEKLVEPRIGNKAQSVLIVGKCSQQFLTRTGMHYQPRFDSSRAQSCKKMDRQYRLSPELIGRMFGDDADT